MSWRVPVFPGGSDRTCKGFRIIFKLVMTFNHVGTFRVIEGKKVTSPTDFF